MTFDWWSLEMHITKQKVFWLKCQCSLFLRSQLTSLHWLMACCLFRPKPLSNIVWNLAFRVLTGLLLKPNYSGKTENHDCGCPGLLSRQAIYSSMFTMLDKQNIGFHDHGLNLHVPRLNIKAIFLCMGIPMLRRSRRCLIFNMLVRRYWDGPLCAICFEKW